MPTLDKTIDNRKHLTGLGVDKLAAAKGTRNEACDRCLLLLMFRHGLRNSEACSLSLFQVDTESRVLHVARLKKGLPTTRPLQPDEIKDIKTWLTEYVKMKSQGDFFFVSERRDLLSRKTAWLAIRKHGLLARLSLPAHPHMLRHAWGFALADIWADTRLTQRLSMTQEHSVPAYTGDQSGAVRKAMVLIHYLI